MSFRQFAATASAVVFFVATAAFAQDNRGTTAQSDGKPVAMPRPVKIFILAGQSNMVGHSRGHTMGTLFNADGPKDEALVDLVFGSDTKLSKRRLDETLAMAERLNELTGGVGDPKIKVISDAAQKAAAEAEATRIKAALEEYKKEVVAASAVSDRVYISSIADGNIKSGKLAVGYGGRPRDRRLCLVPGLQRSVRSRIQGEL